MNILLINPRMPVYLRMPSLPLGLLSIGSYLKAHGHAVAFVERSEKHDLRREVERFRPDAIGISTLSYLSSLDAKKVTARLRRWTDAPIVWGGPAPSTMPEMYLRDGGADYLILGEGEVTWLEFVEALADGREMSEVRGLAFLRGGEFILTPPRPVADLTRFPALDWSMIRPEHYFSSFFHCSKMLYLHASKGCTAQCTFCSNNQFHQGRNRCRTPESVVEDITYLVTRCGANGIYFSDELFVPNRAVRERLMELLIEKDLDLVWGCQTRLGVLNEEDLRLMYRAGCRWILFGIESADPDRLRAIKKGIDLAWADETVRWCKQIGITVQTSFIIGFPHEKPEEMQKTIDLAKRLQANMNVMNILTAIPNSEIYTEAMRERDGFRLPETIKEIAKKEQVATDQVTDNLSDIPSRDLHVVHFYFQWKAFSQKGSVNEDSFGVLKKMALDTLNRIFRHGLKGFVFGTYHSAKQFLTVYGYAHFFPKIKKKYGLE